MASIRALALALAVSSLAGCGGIATNRSLYSTHRPVIERTSVALDLVPDAQGLSDAETHRLDGWLDGLRLHYGDHVTIDDAAGSEPARRAAETLVARRGLVARIGAADAAPGSLRVRVDRARADVPGCPDWSAKSDFDFNNATSSNYGCAVNGNLAAMVADPEHLLHGDDQASDPGGGQSRKAIALYRDAAPTGAKGLPQQQATNSSGGN